MIRIINLLILALGLVSIGSVSMLGIELYDSRQSVENLGLPIVEEEPGIVKYRTENGNDLSVTFENDKVVYMENDWLLQPESSEPLYSDFRFGATSLVDIRDKFGSNGFAHLERNVITTETQLISFNGYQIDSEKNEVLVTITGLDLNDPEVNENNFTDKMLLLAIIIADEAYLDKIWGEGKIYDENYKKIEL
jgi:hypothetical protein